VPLVYWTLLGKNYSFATDSALGGWLNISVHGLDLVIIFIDFVFNRVIYVWGHLIIAIVLVLLYVLWSWIGAAIFPTGGPDLNGFPYFFVNYNTIAPAIYIPLLSIAFILVWTLAMGLHWLKAYIFQGKVRTAPAAVSPTSTIVREH
jgi:hypothetical protein